MILTLTRRSTVIATRSLRELDWALLLLALFIATVGVAQIFSATTGTKFVSMWWKQGVSVGIGLAAMLIMSRINYHSLCGQAPYLYVATNALLVVTFFVGAKLFGSRRWIPLLGGFHFQVSEFAKIVLILMIAHYLKEVRTEKLELHDLLKLAGLTALPFLLVARQPDLTTACSYLAILGASVLLAGMHWRHVAVLAVILLLVLPASWYLMKDYQKDRILTFVNPNLDPQGKGYQAIQSKIAVGNGGVWGQGVTKGSQTQLNFLPVAHTDFIFAAFAEEHGFVGVIIALGLYYLLLLQIVQNAQSAPDRAGTIICIGVAATLLFHVVVNLAMVAGLAPVVGIPLPLMSYGGSNVLLVFMMLGLVNNVRLRQFLN